MGSWPVAHTGIPSLLAFPEAPLLEWMEIMGTPQTRYSGEVRECAVRLVFEYQGEYAS